MQHVQTRPHARGTVFGRECVKSQVASIWVQDQWCHQPTKALPGNKGNFAWRDVQLPEVFTQILSFTSVLCQLATPANIKFARKPAKRPCLLCTRLFRELLMAASGPTSIAVLFSDTGIYSHHDSAQTCHVERWRRRQYWRWSYCCNRTPVSHLSQLQTQSSFGAWSGISCCRVSQWNQLPSHSNARVYRWLLGAV